MTKVGVGVAAGAGGVVGMFIGMVVGGLIAEHQGYTEEEKATWALGLATLGTALGAGFVGGLSAATIPAAIPQTSAA